MVLTAVGGFQYCRTCAILTRQKRWLCFGFVGSALTLVDLSRLLGQRLAYNRREEAFDRIKATVYARHEHGLDEAMERAQRFYELGAYPLTLMAAAMKAMLAALDALRDGCPRDELLLEFGELKQRIGFDEYYEVSTGYDSSRRR